MHLLCALHIAQSKTKRIDLIMVMSMHILKQMLYWYSAYIQQQKKQSFCIHLLQLKRWQLFSHLSIYLYGSCLNQRDHPCCSYFSRVFLYWDCPFLAYLFFFGCNLFSSMVLVCLSQALLNNCRGDRGILNLLIFFIFFGAANFVTVFIDSRLYPSSFSRQRMLHPCATFEQ